MTRPWALQIASDLKRDGLAVELLNESRDVVAEVFRCDADKTVKVNVFRRDVPDAIVRELIQAAREELGAFEDGTPLPETIDSPCNNLPTGVAVFSREPAGLRTLDYAPAEGEKKRVPFWRDREGWKEVIPEAIGELILVPLFIIVLLVVLWLVFGGS